MIDFEFKINDTVIKSPTEYKLDFLPMSDSDRSITGDAVIDGVNAKIKVTLTYTEISETDLLNILGVTWSEFRSSRVITQQITYPVPGGTETANTYFSPNSITLNASLAQRNKWGNYTLEFTEL